MFSSGNLLLIRNYVLRSGETKDKFIIILKEIDDTTKVVASFTTSQAYINPEDITPGCIKTQTKHCYHFPAGKTVSDDGFFFRKDTFVFLFDNVREVDFSGLQIKYPYDQIEVKCKLSDEEHCNLIYCAYNGEFVTMKIKRLLEPLIESLVQKIEERKTGRK